MTNILSWLETLGQIGGVLFLVLFVLLIIHAFTVDEKASNDGR